MDKIAKRPAMAALDCAVKKSKTSRVMKDIATLVQEYVREEAKCYEPVFKVNSIEVDTYTHLAALSSRVQLFRVTGDPGMRYEAVTKLDERIYCSVVVLLHYGLVLVEQPEEVIPDMFGILYRLLSDKENAQIALDTILKISYDTDLVSTCLRRSLLFGEPYELEF